MGSEINRDETIIMLNSIALRKDVAITVHILHPSDMQKLLSLQHHEISNRRFREYRS